MTARPREPGLFAVGPLRLRVLAATSEPLARRLHAHLAGFAADDREAPDLTLEISRRAARAPGDSVVTRSPEVVVRRATGPGSDPALVAGTRLTARAVGRFVKHLHDPGFWRESRWQLFLRHAVEHPVMAVLEQRHDLATIHASTVCGSAGAVLVLGANGSGKSTLATGLCAAEGLELLSDNFTPTSGCAVWGFPGAPRPKRGDSLARLEPVNTTRPVRGVVLVDREPVLDGSDWIRTHVADTFESHRGTAWDDVLGVAAHEREHRERRTVEALAALPTFVFHRQAGSLTDVRAFVRSCGVS